MAHVAADAFVAVAVRVGAEESTLLFLIAYFNNSVDYRASGTPESR